MQDQVHDLQPRKNSLNFPRPAESLRKRWEDTMEPNSALTWKESQRAKCNHHSPKHAKYNKDMNGQKKMPL